MRTLRARAEHGSPPLLPDARRFASRRLRHVEHGRFPVGGCARGDHGMSRCEHGQMRVACRACGVRILLLHAVGGEHATIYLRREGRRSIRLCWRYPSWMHRIC